MSGQGSKGRSVQRARGWSLGKARMVNRGLILVDLLGIFASEAIQMENKGTWTGMAAIEREKSGQIHGF